MRSDVEGEVIRGAVREGIEEAAAIIAGPFVPFLSDTGALIGTVAEELFTRLEPLRRAALVYELRDVEERLEENEHQRARFTDGSLSQEALEMGEDARAAERTQLAAERGALMARATVLKGELWPAPFERGGG